MNAVSESLSKPTGERLRALLDRSTSTNADLPEPAMPPITTLDVGGITVHHRDSGRPTRENAFGPDPAGADVSTEPTYVLVHGLGGSMANWEPVWRFLAPRGRVLTPDLAGFGRTEAPLGQSAVADNVTLLAAYLDAVEARDVVLVGNSMGGMIAAMLTATHPEKVTRLVLIDPVLPLKPQDRPHPMVLATFGMYLCAPLARAVIPRYATRRGLEQMGTDGVTNVVADPRRVPRWVVRRAVEETKALAVVQSAVPSLVKAAQSLVIAAAGPSYARALGRLRVPVTLIHGERDHLVNVSGARRIARANPAWRYVEGVGLGHVPMFEAAEWVAAVIAAATPEG